MEDYLAEIDVNQYLPGAIAWGTNIVLAIVILLIGYWIAGRVGRAVQNIGAAHDNLDDTLFKFLGSAARYVILALSLLRF